MHNPAQSWLEAQLLREMAQVKAPDNLWPRIEAERRARRAMPRTGWVLWPAVATVMLAASCDLVWQSVNAASERVSKPSVVRLRTSQAAGPVSLAAVSCRSCHLEPGLY